MIVFVFAKRTKPKYKYNLRNTNSIWANKSNSYYKSPIERFMFISHSHVWNTNLLSLPCSFFSRTLSHLRSRKRLRRGEALGVELLDQAASSSLDGVISMEGSWRYSLEAERDPGCHSSPFSSRSRSLGSFFIRLILNRRRRRVGVDELDQMRLSWPPPPPPSSSPGPGSSWGTCTWRDGGRRVSVMLQTHHLCRCDHR